MHSLPSGKLAGSFSRKRLPCIETISFQLFGVLCFKWLDPVLCLMLLIFLMPNFFFFFFFSVLVLYKREKILTCCQMRNKPKFSKKCSFSCPGTSWIALSFLAVSSTENVYTKCETGLQITKTERTKGRNRPRFHILTLSLSLFIVIILILSHLPKPTKNSPSKATRCNPRETTTTNSKESNINTAICAAYICAKKGVSQH